MFPFPPLQRSGAPPQSSGLLLRLSMEWVLGLATSICGCQRSVETDVAGTTPAASAPSSASAEIEMLPHANRQQQFQLYRQLAALRTAQGRAPEAREALAKAKQVSTSEER